MHRLLRLRLFGLPARKGLALIVLGLLRTDVRVQQALAIGYEGA